MFGLGPFKQAGVKEKDVTLPEHLEISYRMEPQWPAD